MAIALGRSINDPVYLLLQIVILYAAYYMCLGGALIGVRTVTTVFLEPSPAAKASSSNNAAAADASSMLAPPFLSDFSVTFADLLGTQHDTWYLHRVGDFGFVVAQLLTAPVMAWIFSRIIERRKFVLDFTFTTFALSLITTWAFGQTFPTWWLWWASVGGAKVILYFLAMRLCQAREMMEVAMPAPAMSGGNGNGNWEPGSASKRKKGAAVDDFA